MFSTPTRNVPHATKLESYIGAQVATGLYSNSSEVERSARQLMTARGEARRHGELRRG